MGASCTPRVGPLFGPSGPRAPEVLTPGATASEVVAAVNANTERISTYQADRASITLPGAVGLPLLTATIAVERPQRFRMRATTRLTGPEVDLGSNDERFWFWARRNEPPAVYTARHADRPALASAAQLPIEPSWLIDALGMATLDPRLAYQGPFSSGGSDNSAKLELRAKLGVEQGGGTVVYVIDSRTAWVLEQHRYDAAGSLLASVNAERFRYDPIALVSYPEKVSIHAPATDMRLTIDVGPVVLNAPIASGGQIWSLPQIAEAPIVDLANAGAFPSAVRSSAFPSAAARSPWAENGRIAAPLGPMAGATAGEHQTVQETVLEPRPAGER